MFNMAADHAIWPKENDAIFGLAQKAKDAIDKYGRDKVIDSTLGTLADDNGKLICFETVYDELKSMPNEYMAAYAQITGQPDFLEAVIKSCFREYKPDAHVRAVATPGGCGAVRHAIWTYSNPGDSIIVGDWYWAPYSTIAEEFGRTVTTYELFNNSDGFNVAAFKEKFEELLNKQKRILAIFNTPANNPTGYSLSDDEWDAVLDIVKENSKNSEFKITLLVDVAYIDYAGESTEKRKFFKKFSNLPENVFVTVAFSMSKGYTMYGMRSGAAIGISSSEDVAEEFYYSLSHANRANWSNGNRGAMTVMTNIASNPQKQKDYEEEVTKAKTMLRKRANAFVAASKEARLEILPYRDGFFVSIPCKDAKKASDELIRENVFVVSLKKGLRFAVCAVSEQKCKEAPAIIKKVLDNLA
ncbi:MAG: pyridoxal phosphate-dependent aminotransferase [Sedimentibacter sp.]